MLINLSNHPTENWNELQLKTANLLFGKVIDLEFPQLSPEGDKDLINAIVKNYRDICIKILSDSEDSDNAVHIMGEMTFTYALVNELKNVNISCIASTTDRNTYEFNGSKISNFNFVRFREY